MTERKQIAVLLRVNPFCNHPTHVKGCVYCEDAQRNYRKLLQIQEQTRNMQTRIDVLGATNNIEGEKFPATLPGDDRFERVVRQVLRAINVLRIFDKGVGKAAFGILCNALEAEGIKLDYGPSVQVIKKS